MLRAESSDRRLLLEMIDEGQGFEPELPGPDLERSRAGRWGLSIVATDPNV
jgi:signal transduction histidine kinase